MKKHLISILAILLVSVFILSSCGGNDDALIEQLQGQINELKDELSEAKNENKEKDKEIADLKEQIQDLLNDKDYTVTFDINGGVGEIESQTVRYKKTVNEPTVPTKEYYDFAGWYVNGEKAEFPYVVTCNTDFVAHYTPTKYTITYNVNGGVMPDTYISEYDVETDVTLPTPTRSLYLFDGWYEDAKFEGAKVTSIPVGEVGNKTYYAKWLSTTDGITYQLANNGTTYTVTGYEGKDTIIVVPSSIDGIPVTAIANNAFTDKQRIKSITVPDSVTSIGTYAFSGCVSLAELNLGNGIKKIPAYMVQGCNKLQSIVIPDSVTSIGYDAFYSCSSLASVYINDLSNWCNISFDTLSSNPLYCADNLYVNGELVTELVIPDDVIIIESYAFCNLDCITSVVIPDSVTSIGDSAFQSCSSLTSVVIGDSVTSIGNYAFYYCDNLVSVVIGDSVTSIGNSAFQSCSRLKSVVIGDNVTSIGNSAFYNCYSLYVVYNNSDILLEIESANNGYVAYYAKILVDYGENIYRNDGYNYTLTDDGFLFREKNSKYELIAYIGGEDTVTLPEGIKGNSYNLYCISGVVNVIIPEGFTAINDYAFYGLFYFGSTLTSVVIPDSVTSIGGSAFYNCISLAEVYYNGTAAEWNSISISYSNDLLTNATRYYYSETEPTEEGNFWHWGENGEVVVW